MSNSAAASVTNRMTSCRNSFRSRDGATFELGAGGELQLTEGLRLLLKKEKIYGYTFEGKRHDTGDSSAS